jgi:hypothetical protein
MEPDGLLKPSIWFVGEVPTQSLRGPVLVELETTDQSSRVGKFNHRKKSAIGMARL